MTLKYNSHNNLEHSVPCGIQAKYCGSAKSRADLDCPRSLKDVITENLLSLHFKNDGNNLLPK